MTTTNDNTPTPMLPPLQGTTPYEVFLIDNVRSARADAQRWKECALRSEQVFVASVELINDWKKGDFALPYLAECDAKSLESACERYSESCRSLPTPSLQSSPSLVKNGILAHPATGRTITSEACREEGHHEARQWRERAEKEQARADVAEHECGRWRECAETFFKQYDAGVCGRMLDEDLLGRKARELYHELCSPTSSPQSSLPTAPAPAAPETATASRLQALESKQELLLRRTDFLMGLCWSLNWVKDGQHLGSSRTAWPADLALTGSTSTSPPTSKPASSGGGSCG